MNTPLQNELPGMIRTNDITEQFDDEEIDDLVDRVQDLMNQNQEMVIRIQNLLNRIRILGNYFIHQQIVHDFNQEILKVSRLELYKIKLHVWTIS